MIFSDVYGAEAEPQVSTAPRSVLSLGNENQGSGVNRRRLSSSSCHALQGLEDDEDSWKNISEVIRLSFKDVLKRLRIQEQRNETLSRQVESLTNQLTQKASFEANRTIELERKFEEQGDALKKATKQYQTLVHKLDLKADSAYVTDCLLTKANKSDLCTVEHSSRSNFESTSQTTTRILMEQLRSQSLQIEHKADKAHCQIQELSQIQRGMQQVLGKIESQLPKFALVSEVNKCLELKANKVAVATALHRKANKENVAESIQILERKVHHKSPSLQQEALVNDLESVEKKIQKLERLTALNASAIQSLPSIDKVSSGLQRLHAVLEKQVSSAREDVLEQLYKSAADLRVEVEGKIQRSVFAEPGSSSGGISPEEEKQDALAISSTADVYKRLGEIEKTCQRCLDVSWKVDQLAAEVERIRVHVGESREGILKTSTAGVGRSRQGMQTSTELGEDYRSWLSPEPSVTSERLRSVENERANPKPPGRKVKGDKVKKKKKKVTKKSSKAIKQK